jgi:hypothetical protein
MDGIYNKQLRSMNTDKFNVELLSDQELIQIDGGKMSPGTSFAYDVAYVFGAIARGIKEFAQGAMEYQASLPPNLKK